MIYFDNHTTTRPCQSAIERMQYYLEECWGIPSSLHAHGIKVADDLEKHYQAIYDLAGADIEDTFIFTSSIVEAINRVIFSSYLQYCQKEGKNQFITSAIEDAATLNALQRLQDNFNCRLKMVPVKKDGCIDLEALQKACNPKTALISLSWAQALSGVIHPVEEVCQIALERNIPLHIDATYAIGKVYLSLKDLPISYLTIASDRIHGPKSAAGIFLKKNSYLPFLTEQDARPLYFDMPSFAGFSSACQQALLSRDLMSLEVVRLRDKLASILVKELGAKVLFEESSRLPNVLVMSFAGVWHEALLYALNRKGVLASFGGGFNPLLSNVLLASGYEKELSHSSLSFSLSRYTTDEEVERGAEVIIQEVKKLRSISGENA